MSNKFWVVDNGEWRLVEGEIRKKLEPGLYELTVVEQMMGPPVLSLVSMKPKTDALWALPDSLCEYIVGRIERFWESKAKYAKMGLVHKRGVLLDGPPGTGKTAICLLVGQQIADRGGVAIFTSPKTNIAALPGILKSIRDFHTDLPLLNIMEDIDKHRRQTDVMLPMLDGENQVNNIFHLATTNFKEKLDSRLINRPSRFDEIIHAVPPSQKAREAYLRQVFPEGDIPTKTIKLVVKHAAGLNFAHLKELAVATYVYEVDPAVTAKKLKAMETAAKVSHKNEEDD